MWQVALHSDTRDQNNVCYSADCGSTKLLLVYGAGIRKGKENIIYWR